eukprot:jgi/Picsp_1/3286/NSC_06126-R1_---NA---
MGMRGNRKILQESNSTLKANDQKDGGKKGESKNIETKNSTQVDIKQEDDSVSLVVPALKLRCTQFPTWNAEQVKRCLAFAEDGIEYDPTIFDDDDEDIVASRFVDDGYQSQSMYVAGHSVSSSTIFQFLGLMAAAVLMLKYSKVVGKSRIWNSAISRAQAKLGRRNHIFWYPKRMGVPGDAHEG